MASIRSALKSVFLFQFDVFNVSVPFATCVNVVTKEDALLFWKTEHFYSLSRHALINSVANTSIILILKI